MASKGNEPMSRIPLISMFAVSILVGGCTDSPHTKQQVVADVCRMPRDFWRRRNVGMLQLMHESGYPHAHAQITEVDIEAHLRANPDLVDDWIQESENGRSDSVWVLVDSAAVWNKRNQWTVFFMAPGGDATDLRLFENRYSATAFFIKHYTDQMLTYRFP